MFKLPRSAKVEDNCLLYTGYENALDEKLTDAEFWSVNRGTTDGEIFWIDSNEPNSDEEIEGDEEQDEEKGHCEI